MLLIFAPSGGTALKTGKILYWKSLLLLITPTVVVDGSDVVQEPSIVAILLQDLP